jgi:outer membrane receptor for ferrienterochelin and colicins
MFRYLLTGLFVLAMNAAFSQLRGIVFGLENGEKKPLEQAEVVLKNAQTLVYTDEEGRFSLILPKELPDTMIVSAFGFTTDSVVLTKEDRFTGLEIVLTGENELEEFVVEYRRGTKGINRLSPIAIEELGEGELKKAACCNLSESFETNATVDVNITDAISGAKKIQMLGLDGVYTQMQFENIPFLTGLEGSFGMNTIPGTWVESIQITKGTGTVVNGYESMAGLINAEFRKPSTMQRLSVNGYGSILGRGELNIHGGQLLGKKWSTGTFAHISGMQTEHDRNNDGFRDLPLSKTASFLNRWEYNGEKFESRFGVNAYYDEREGGQLRSRTNPYTANTVNRHADVFGKTGFLFPKSGHQSLGIVYQAKAHTIDGNFGARKFSGEEYRGYVNAIYDRELGSAAHALKAGASLVGQDLTQKLDSVTIARSLLTPGVFAEYTYTGTRITAVLGARYDSQKDFGDQFSPRLHVKIIADEYTDIRLTTGKAWRLPNVIIDNSSLLATNKAWSLPGKIQQEVVWNSGISVVRRLKLFRRESSVTADFYHARFQRQLVIDRERSTDTFYFEFQENNAFSNAFQAEFSFMPARTLTLRFAYKYLQVMAKYDGKLVQQVMIPQHRGLFNVAWLSRNKKWEADATLSVFGKVRLHDVLLPDGTHLHGQTGGPVPMVLAQLTHHFRKFDAYLGGENLANFTQADPIISAGDPYNAAFDATRTWAPVLGTIFYAGVRFEIDRKTGK